MPINKLLTNNFHKLSSTKILLIMGRQGGDPTMVTSSIALLQERFRQLQKNRERREEKELLKLFSESGNPTMPNRLNLQPAYRQPHQDSAFSLGLNSVQSWQTDFGATENPAASTSLRPNNSSTSAATSRNFGNSDVDTSLHL